MINTDDNITESQENLPNIPIKIPTAALSPRRVYIKESQNGQLLINQLLIVNQQFNVNHQIFLAISKYRLILYEKNKILENSSS